MAEDRILVPAATFVATAALLAYLVARRRRAPLFSGFVATVASLLAWVGGSVLAVLAGDAAGMARVGVLLHFAGVFATTASFAVLAARFARVGLAEDDLPALRLATAAPATLCFGLVATNPWHGQFGLALDGSFFALSTREWAGPLYPVLIGWVYLTAGAALAACVRRAIQTPDADERRRLVAISGTASVPLAAYAAHAFGLLPLPPEFPAATTSLAATVGIVVLGIARWGFLDTGLLLLHDVIEHLGDGILLADAEGRVVDANPAARRLADRDPAGAPLADVLRSLGDDGAGAAAALEPEPRSGALRLETPAGRTVDLRVGPVRGRRGEPAGFFAVLGDRTEQQRYERLRERAQRLESLGVLVGGIAHEINNPLSFVRSNLNHLGVVADDLTSADARKREEALAELREILRDSREGLGRIASVVATTRSLAPRDGRLGIGPVDLNVVVAEAVELASRYPGVAARAETRLDPALPRVEGIAARLRQVVVNLLVNAGQAAGPEGHVRVATLADGSAVELRVEDDGPGVPEPLLERIFDPFFTTKDPDVGMGLGLSIIHDVVRDHDGSVGVARSELGGAAFRVRLPASARRSSGLASA